jgi:hypothetical protein
MTYTTQSAAYDIRGAQVTAAAADADAADARDTLTGRAARRMVSLGDSKADRRRAAAYRRRAADSLTVVVDADAAASRTAALRQRSDADAARVDALRGRQSDATLSDAAAAGVDAADVTAAAAARIARYDLAWRRVPGTGGVIAYRHVARRDVTAPPTRGRAAAAARAAARRAARAA